MSKAATFKVSRQRVPVYVERSGLDLDRLYINGGARGFLVGITPADLAKYYRV